LLLSAIKTLAESFLEGDGPIEGVNAILWANQCQQDELGEDAMYHKSFNVIQTYDHTWTSLPSDFIRSAYIFEAEQYGTCDDGCTTTSIVLKTNGSSSDDAYNDMQMSIGSEVKAISDYVGSTTTATTAAFTAAPSEDDNYVIITNLEYFEGGNEILMNKIRIKDTGGYVVYYHAVPSTISSLASTPDANSLLHRAMAYYLAARHKFYEDEESYDGTRLMEKFEYQKETALMRVRLPAGDDPNPSQPGYGKVVW